MKITNGAIVELINAIQKFGNVDGKLGYTMARALRILREEVKDYDEQRSKLVEKYGKKSEDGENIFIDPEDEETYKKFIEELMPILNYAIEVNIPQIPEKEFDFFPLCETATVNDYNILEQVLVDHKADKKDKKDKNNK